MKQKPVMQHFINRHQAQAINAAMRGEERAHFARKIAELQAIVDAMPVTYETEAAGIADPVCSLHYFRGSVDVWLTELDKGAPGDTIAEYQCQAFGLTDLGYGPELGYVCLPEILSAGLEIDLHWTPQTVSQILAKKVA